MRGSSSGSNRPGHPLPALERIAFAWKLASLGIPTVLIYLGFLGDSGIADVGTPFKDESDWQGAFGDHASPIVPYELFEHSLETGSGKVWFLLRAREVLEASPTGDVKI